MPVSGHQRAKAQVVVDVFIAIDVHEFAAMTFGHEYRIGIVGAVIAGHTEGNTFLRLFMSFRGLRRALLVQ